MKILFLTSRLPYPPNRGDRLRVFHFARMLAGKHDLTLASFISSRSQLSDVPRLKEIFKSVHTVQLHPLRSVINTGVSIFRPDALQVSYYRSRAMRQLLAAIGKQANFDLVYTHLVRMAPYGLLVPARKHILDITDVISKEIRLSLQHRKPPGKWLYEVELAKLVETEQRYTGQFDENWVISQPELLALEEINPTAKIRIVTNGVDYSVFTPKEQQPGSPRIVFVGHMGVFHNVDAAIYLADEIYPAIRQRIPGATLSIVGAEPARQVLDLAQVPGVSVHGYVPDLASVLHEAALFIAPLRFAAGIQNKILEAMATATPVITTPLVNQGIGAQPGRDIVLAEGSSGFVDAAADILADNEKARLLGLNGLRYVREHFRWSLVNQAVDALN